MAEELTTQTDKHRYGSKPEVDQADLIEQAKRNDQKMKQVQTQKENLTSKTLNRKRN